MVRVQTQRDEGARLELRSPDSSANPYLVFALCLAAWPQLLKDRRLKRAERKYPETLRGGEGKRRH
ncbi:MAG: hypothetical protein ACLRMZ_00540 [Blautia marasmi]